MPRPFAPLPALVSCCPAPIRRRVGSLPLLCALALLALPAAAQAACADALSAAADEVQMGAGLGSGPLRSVRSACGDSGAASLVATLVARGACDHAAQLARSLPGQGGMDGAQLSADQCLANDLDETLAALDKAVGQPRSAPSPDDAGASWDPAPQEKAQRYAGAGRSSGLLGSLSGAEAEEQSGFGGLGTRGSGVGGGGDGYGSGRGDASGPRRSRGRAATGMAPSAATAKMLDRDAPVAFSRLSLGVWFDYDSSALRPEALGTIGTLAQQLRRMDDGAVLEVAGHTDSTGSWYYNADLSQQRARAVRQALILAGVPSSRLTVVGLGEDYPVASNGDTWGRAQNRRVEFRFYKTVATRSIAR